jgi:ABC-type multidrug transport system permease subunit
VFLDSLDHEQKLTSTAGVIAQTQPKFIANRDIFEAREKKAKLYSWWAFCFGEIVAEVPYLLVCALLYFAPWYVSSTNAIFNLLI